MGGRFEPRSRLGANARLVRRSVRQLPAVPEDKDGEVEEPHSRIHSIFAPVDFPSLVEHVFYVEQFADGDPSQIYRQRLYRSSFLMPAIQRFSQLYALVGLLFAGVGEAKNDRPSFILSAAVHATAQETFVEHLGNDGGSRYLTLTVPNEPVQALRVALEEQLGRSLQHRGEAHITVLTPPEYQVLAPYVSIEQVHALARAAEIQRVSFEIQCVGRGEAAVDGADEQTYFVVVESAALRTLRQQIFDTYVAGGGPASRFNPAAWDPHITIGFTQRDLHASDGVHKGENACWATLEARAIPVPSGGIPN